MRSSLLVGLVAAAAYAQQPSNQSQLVPFTFDSLPLGSVTPSGWLLDQIQLMADGLAGHEYEFYSFVAQSNWIGGSETYSDLNEGLPYWFNGLVYMAYTLNDPNLKNQVHTVMGQVLALQQDDGWLGPETGTERNFWGREPMLLGMAGLAEANATWEAQIVPAMYRFNAVMNEMLSNNYTGYIAQPTDTFQETWWGRARYGDLILALQWLYENYPSNDNDTQMLFDNMQLLRTGGFSWETWWTEENYFGIQAEGDDNLILNIVNNASLNPFFHDVNVAMALKTGGVLYRYTNDQSLAAVSSNGFNWTMVYHSAASGSILGDEQLDGLKPYSGSEFCTAVEASYSGSYLYQLLGDNFYADRVELLAFNSMPAMASSDWWTHQYLEQPNQPSAANMTNGVPFHYDGSWSTTFGLEPQIPCCTVNHPQGLPKFVANSWVAVQSSGLAHALLGPSEVQTTLGDGQQVSVSCDTAYPFLDTLTYTVNATEPFDFYVRVPGWASSSSNITVNGTTSSLSPDAQTGLHHISVGSGQSTIVYNLPSSVYTTPRQNDTIAVYKGAVLYALEVTNSNTSTLPKVWGSNDNYYPDNYAPPQVRDYQLFNTSAWNYAIDPSTIQYVAANNGTSSTQLNNPLFAPGGPPGYMTAQACLIDWPLLFSTPDVPPTGDDRTCIGDAVQVFLVPYGSAKTRMTDLPTIDLSSS